MTIRLSTGTRNRLLGEQGTDTGANGLRGIFKDGVIKIYTGNQPATADTATTGSTLLGTVTVGAGAFTPGVATNGLEFGAPVAGVIAKSGSETWQFTAVNTGTAGWWRFVGNATDDGSLSTSLPRIDGSCGVTSGDLLLSTTAIVSGVTTTIDTFQITLGGG